MARGIKLKGFDTFINRLERLPQYGENVMFALMKKDASKMVNNFRQGISKNSLGLTGLSPKTIQKKEAQGLSKPYTPLYGSGKQDPLRSYLNMLRLRKLKKGYTVRPSTGIHHSRVMELSHLFSIHEYGCTIQRGQTLIRIPPRPAFKLSFQQLINKLNTKEKSKHITKAVDQYIKTGKKSFLQKILSWFKGEESIEE